MATDQKAARPTVAQEQSGAHSGVGAAARFGGKDPLHLYWQLLTIRGFEEQVDRHFQQGLIYGTTHLCIGQEAVAVGAMAAIEADDYITSTHRGHGHALAKGSDPARMMAELMGKATGYSRGKGGSMHIADFETGNLGANGVVAGGITVATGAALALKMQGRSQVVLCFFGDGATNEGDFHEALNMAAVWDLPVVFICENNQYGMSGSVERMSGNPRLHERAISYGMPGVAVDGNCIEGVYDAVAAAVARARRGEGPSLVVCDTYRYKGHSKSDANRYRTREEIAEWQAKDPLPRFKVWLLSAGYGEDELRGVEERAAADVESAVKFALESPDPDPAEVDTDVYA